MTSDTGRRVVRLDHIDSPSVGCVYQAREWKKHAWKGVQALRRKLREAPLLGGGRGAIRLELIRAESAHGDAVLAERQALRAVEQRANELGLTIVRAPKAG